MERPHSKPRPWKQQRQSQVIGIASRSRDPFYHSARWTRESRAFRKANPLCSNCQAKGFITPSEVTDHIIPKDICPDPWEKNNWTALCIKCHAKKGPQDKKLFKKKRL